MGLGRTVVAMLVLAVSSEGLGFSELHGDEAIFLRTDSYVVWRIQLPPGAEEMGCIARWMVDTASGFPVAQASFRVDLGPSGGVSARSGSAVSLDARGAPCGVLECGFVSLNGFAPPSVQEFDFIVLVGADGGWEGTLSLSLPPGSSAVRRASGTAFFADETEFADGAMIHAWFDRANARVVERASYGASATTTMFAAFVGEPGIGGDMEMSYEGPDGAVGGSHEYFLSGLPPGGYAFHVGRHVDAGSRYWVVGADMALG